MAISHGLTPTLAILILSLVASCQAERAVPPERVEVAASYTPAATQTPIPSPTAVRTPPALPPIYASRFLNPLDAPHTYVADTCGYLRDKWDGQKAAPGTVVLVVMLHSISQGKPESSDAINEAYFARMMADLHRQNFQAINMLQLADFLEHNSSIPLRSVVLMQDGRRLRANFDAHFRSFWDEWSWPVVNAWDNQGSTTDALWEQQIDMESLGWVDHQVYGPTLRINAEHTTDQYLTDQLQQPITVFRERFGKDPIAVVWPSGFGARPVQIARTLGYRLGFTFNPRGPLMYNWVPLSDSPDHFRPSYFPEGSINDPLMTLPRYWPNQIHDILDSVRLTGKEAAAYAEQNKAVELEYYDIVCADAYGPIQP